MMHFNIIVDHGHKPYDYKKWLASQKNFMTLAFTFEKF